MKSKIKIIVPMIIVVICLFIFIQTMIKNSDAYQTAIKFISENQVITERYGDELKENMLVFGNVKVFNKNGRSIGTAELKIGFTGGSDRFTVYIELEKKHDLWNVKYYEIEKNNR